MKQNLIFLRIALKKTYIKRYNQFNDFWRNLSAFLNQKTYICVFYNKNFIKNNYENAKNKKIMSIEPLKQQLH